MIRLDKIGVSNHIVSVSEDEDKIKNSNLVDWEDGITPVNSENLNAIKNKIISNSGDITALSNAMLNLQPKNDNSLETINKNIPSAINELKREKFDKVTVSNNILKFYANNVEKYSIALPTNQEVDLSEITNSLATKYDNVEIVGQELKFYVGKVIKKTITLPTGEDGSIDLSAYQTKNDSTLTTKDKTVVGAINEIALDTSQIPTDLKLVGTTLKLIKADGSEVGIGVTLPENGADLSNLTLAINGASLQIKNSNTVLSTVTLPTTSVTDEQLKTIIQGMINDGIISNLIIDDNTLYKIDKSENYLDKNRIRILMDNWDDVYINGLGNEIQGGKTSNFYKPPFKQHIIIEKDDNINSALHVVEYTDDDIFIRKNENGANAVLNPNKKYKFTCQKNINAKYIFKIYDVTKHEINENDGVYNLAIDKYKLDYGYYSIVSNNPDEKFDIKSYRLKTNLNDIMYIHFHDDIPKNIRITHYNNGDYVSNKVLDSTYFKVSSNKIILNGDVLYRYIIPTGVNEIYINKETSSSEEIIDNISIYLSAEFPFEFGVKKINNEDININDKIILKDVLTELLKLPNECKNFKGVFNSEFTDYYDRNDGDFYYFNESEYIFLDMKIVEPHSIIYCEKGFFKSLKLNNKEKSSLNSCYDVCIAGGGAGGIGAGYALINSGYNVIMVDSLDKLGGTHLHGGVNWLIATPIGDWYKDLCRDAYNANWMKFSNDTVVGDGDEFEQKWRSSLVYDKNNTSFRGGHLEMNPWWTSNRYYEDLTNGGIEVRLNTKVIDVYNNEDKVRGIKVQNIKTKEIYNIYADYFIDCSADGILCCTNKEEGQDYYLGSDAKTLFNEPSIANGFEGDRYGINTVELAYIEAKNYNFLGKEPVDEYALNKPKMKKFTDITSNYNHLIEIPDAKERYFKFCSPSKHMGLSNNLFIDYGHEVTYSEAVKRTLSHFYHYRTPLAGYRYLQPCPLLAIRESNRVKCEKMITEQDLGIKITSSNIADKHIIALSTWWVDIHNDTFPSSGVSTPISLPNGVPYESIIPVGLKNTLVACRAFGASHIALSSVRLAKTMMSLGYASGKAMLQMCEDWKDDTREVDVSRLQSDCGVLDTINELETYFPHLFE